MLAKKKKKKRKSSWAPALGLIPRSSIPATCIPPGVTHFSRLSNGKLPEMVAMVMGDLLLSGRWVGRWGFRSRGQRAESKWLRCCREEDAGSSTAHGGEAVGSLILLAPLRRCGLNGPIVHREQMHRFRRPHRKAFCCRQWQSYVVPQGRSRSLPRPSPDARQPGTRQRRGAGRRRALCV